MAQVVIVGAGPTGAALALLLAQRGIHVTLIEAAKDFRRVFRGEGLMPSGLDALAQMGCADLLATLPSSPLTAWEFIVGGQSLFRVEEPMDSDSRVAQDDQLPCTLVAQPPLLKALIERAKGYPTFTFIQGIGVKDVIWTTITDEYETALDGSGGNGSGVNEPGGNGPGVNGTRRVSGVYLADGRTIHASLVIGADGRNSVVRQRVGLDLVTQPKSIDVLWFKLSAHPRLVDNNVFYSIVNQRRVFSVFHSAEEGQMHLAWVVYPDTDGQNASNQTNQKEANQQYSSQEWAERFAALSPDWLAQHFRTHHDAIASPIRLSVMVGLCPSWHKPGVLLLGDAAHPMSPVRAQGINMAFRDVIVAANHLAPIFNVEGDRNPEGDRIFRDEYKTEAKARFSNALRQERALDRAIAIIQAEREPEIILAQKLQASEAQRGELLRSNTVIRSTILQLSPLSCASQ